jgi:6-phosphogluconolactonase
MSSEKYASQSLNQNYQRLFDPSAEQLVTVVADRTVAAILHSWREGRDSHIVITGGRTGLAIAQALDVGLFRASSERGSGFSAERRVHIWFSDERFLSTDESDRSDTTLIAAFTRSREWITFERVGAPESTDLDGAARAYAAALDQSVGEDRRFDSVILSMGEDGHIASLFPGHDDELNSTNSALAIDNSPKPPAMRVSIGVARLARASAIYIFAVGESKREALTELLDGGHRSPISMLRKNSPATQIYITTDIKL